MKVVLVGVGNLGLAIARSLLHSHPAGDVVLVEKDARRRDILQEQLGCSVVSELTSEQKAGPQDLLILAVKPQDAAATCQSLAPFVSQQAVVLSVMAGIRTDSLARNLNNTKIVRAMPNLGASIDESATAYYCSSGLTSAEVERVGAIVSQLGKSWRIDSEELIDALTAVSGTGPAYLCWLGEQIERVALEFGVSPADAHAIVLQTLRGTVLYLEQSELTFGELRKRVTSPNGTTAAAMSVLQEKSADAAVREAILAARKRAQELGG